jgi:hypothetical protein
MREVRASVSTHTMAGVLTVIRACGFSHFKVSIGPATVMGLAAS